MKIAVVGDSDMIVGFRLAGLDETYEIKSDEEGYEKIKMLDEKDDIGLIIIPEKLGEKIRPKLKDIKKFIVEVPDKEGPITREHDPVKILVRKAVGIELK